MQDISRAILLPPPSPPTQRTSLRGIQSDSEPAIEAARGRHQPQGATQAFLTLNETRREDAVEIKGKHFRFRPYSNGATREAVHTSETETLAGSTESDDEAISVDILDGFAAGARARNSSAFIASFIAQERLRQGLHNPQFEAASDAYRRAGGSPSEIDNLPRVLSFAV